jgi:hypothetical protein
MTSNSRLRVALLPVLTSISLAACSGASEPAGPGSGGSPARGGTTGTGGATTGGVASGGVSTGGIATTTGGIVGTGGIATNTGGAIGGAGKAGATGGAGGSISPGTGGAGGYVGTGGAGGGVAGGKGMAGGGGTSATGGAGGGANPGGGTATGTSSTENTGATCKASAADLKKNTKLPDPFAMHDGTRITMKSQWECRRNEIKKDIEKYEIGPKQEPPTVAATLSGTKLSVKVTNAAGSITLTSTVGTASGTGPSCVAIGMNGNSSLISGCVQVPFMHDQVVKYAQDSTQSKSDPYYTLYPDQFGKTGNYTAWSWGISRLIDGLDQVKDQLKIDMTKIAVHGCSYAGKMALFGGAFDERVALTIAQESGGGGINSWRTSADFKTRTGTDIEKIDNTNYAWFMSSMKSLDPYSLPHDHHELIAMIAPRAVIAMGNGDYDWLGDESGYKSIMAAKEVFKAMGIEDHIGFDFTSGHTHCQAAASQTASAKAFVDKFLKGQTADTNIAIKPTKSGFQLDPSTVIDWTTPTLQ